jgi:hypothetical protein
MRRPIRITIVVFLGLTFVYLVLIAATKTVADPLDQLVLVDTASAIFGAGLAAFLIQFLRESQGHN